MNAYVGRRVLQLIPLLFGITVVLFAVIQAAPGGPEGALLESGRFIDPQVIESYRRRLGVDQPVARGRQRQKPTNGHPQPGVCQSRPTSSASASPPSPDT